MDDLPSGAARPFLRHFTILVLAFVSSNAKESHTAD